MLEKLYALLTPLRLFRLRVGSLDDCELKACTAGLEAASDGWSGCGGKPSSAPHMEEALPARTDAGRAGRARTRCPRGAVRLCSPSPVIWSPAAPQTLLDFVGRRSAACLRHI